MRPVGHTSENVSVRKGARASALSAAVLVVGAVAVALMLVATTADDGSAQSQPEEQSDSGSAGADSTVTPGTGGQPPSTESSVPDEQTGAIVDAGSNNNISVQVANTTSVNGAAATLTDTLKTQGYLTLNPTNASSGSLATTKIHYSAGMLLEARALAEFLQLDVETSVFAMPTDPASDVSNFLNPRILVLIGSDLAA